MNDQLWKDRMLQGLLPMPSHNATGFKLSRDIKGHSLKPVSCRIQRGPTGQFLLNNDFPPFINKSDVNWRITNPPTKQRTKKKKPIATNQGVEGLTLTLEHKPN